MPNKKQLELAGERIRAQVETVMSDEKLSSAERAEKLKGIQAEKDAFDLDVKNSEAAEALTKGLPESGSSAGDPQVLDAGAGSHAFVTDWNPRRKAAQLALQIMRHPLLSQSVKDLGGAKGQITGLKSQFDHKFEIGLKDSTAAGNVMGEGLYGTTGPTPAGQNPFLPGAFGPGILPNFLPGIVEQRFYQLTISDLFTSIPTTSPDITYLVEATANFNASAVAEGGLYPFSSGTFSRVYEQIGKIANAAEFTDEVIRDAPVLFNFLQGRLIEGVQRQEEVQLLAGQGYPGVNGLLNRSSGFTIATGGLTATNVAIPAAGTVGTGAVAATIPTVTYGRQIKGVGTPGTAPTGQAIAEGIFSAIIDVELALFFKPNAIIMNPLDWRTVRLAKDANGQYFGGGFFGNNYGYPKFEGIDAMPGGDSLWNTRVVETPACPQGTILVGYFGPETAQTVRREGISMQMTNTNGTNFVNGEVTLRAEERVGLMVYRPKAFELIQLANA